MNDSDDAPIEVISGPTPDGGSGSSADARPTVSFAQEMRFAIVMYGGTSLAIYINGVAQELYALVRATAPDPETGKALLSDVQLSRVERVYRRLGQLIDFEGSAADLPPKLDPAEEAERREQDPIRTRFVIDILSGTSAGGLNAIFLAKALANEQEITSLKTLWRDQADISLLINDKRSVKDLGLTLQQPPASVLNSQRMYFALLNALDVMEPEMPVDEDSSRLVEQLDCWITATDIQGLPLPLDTFDRFIYERRHKKVFHLVYRGLSSDELADAPQDRRPHRSDFGLRFNPFLAYAGRCSAAFPFAFEPMQLKDIDAVISHERFSNTYASHDSNSDLWRPFFEEYLKVGGGRSIDDTANVAARIEAYRTASFGDGGYLDNKPFTYATDQLAYRRAPLPVDRRLIYVEPDPTGKPPVEFGQHWWRQAAPPADFGGQSPLRPNAIQNVEAALLKLPRVETIREDLELLARRNRAAARQEDLAWSVDKALRDDRTPLEGRRRRSRSAGPSMPPLERWLDMSSDDWMRQRGFQFRAYYRLHLASVLDDLALTVTRAAGFDEQSDERLAIRCFIAAWADLRYPETGSGEQSQNRLLYRFDLAYRLRRAQFLQQRIDTLLRFGDDAKARLLDHGASAEDVMSPSDWSQPVARALYALKRKLEQTRGELLASGRKLWRRDDDANNPLLPLLHDLPISTDTLRHVLEGARTEEESVLIAAEDLTSERLQAFDDVAEAITQTLAQTFSDVRRQTTRALRPEHRGDDLPGRMISVVLTALRSDYDHYDLYDSVIFPLSYGRDGEADRVEIIRVSPEDATSIIKEEPGGRRKLAGTGINHFGGFFDKRWRRNDILWGRLDAAERIIDTTLIEAPQTLRDQLVEQAQLAIIEDEFSTGNREQLAAEVVTLALTAEPGSPPAATQRGRDELIALVSAMQQPQQILDFLKNSYEIDRRLDFDQMLDTAGRATVVTSAVLDGISAEPHVRLVTRWLARAGRVAVGFAELAAPTTPRAIPRRLAFVLAFAGVVMVILGITFGSDPTAHTGWLLLIGLAIVGILVWTARDVFKRRSSELSAQQTLLGTAPRDSWITPRVKWVAAAAAVVLAGLAITEIVAHLIDDIRGLL